jgi:hypothetical protein
MAIPIQRTHGYIVVLTTADSAMADLKRFTRTKKDVSIVKHPMEMEIAKIVADNTWPATDKDVLAKYSDYLVATQQKKSEDETEQSSGESRVTLSEPALYAKSSPPKKEKKPKTKPVEPAAGEDKIMSHLKNWSRPKDEAEEQRSPQIMQKTQTDPVEISKQSFLRKRLREEIEEDNIVRYSIIYLSNFS